MPHLMANPDNAINCNNKAITVTITIIVIAKVQCQVIADSNGASSLKPEDGDADAGEVRPQNESRKIQRYKIQIMHYNG